MSTQPEIRVLTADERASLKRLASRVKDYFRSGHWEVDHRFGAVCQDLQDWVLLTPNPNLAKEGRELLLDYVGAVPADLTLGTLAYVEQLEAALDKAAGESGSPLGGAGLLMMCLRYGSSEDLDYIFDKLSRRCPAGKEMAKQAERSAALLEELADQEREKLELVRELLKAQNGNTTNMLAPSVLWERYQVKAAECPDCGLAVLAGEARCLCGEQMLPTRFMPPASPSTGSPAPEGELAREVGSKYFLNGDPAINPFGPR